MNILKALYDGKEIVVISPDHNDDSAIFWIDDNKTYSFSRHLGTMLRTDKTPDQIAKHIEQIEKSGGLVVCRGIR